MSQNKELSFWYKLFSKVPALKNWLDNRALRLALQSLDKEYQELETKAKDANERGALEAEWQFERDAIQDPIESENSERLVAQARKYHILVPRISEESEDWYHSQTMGGWILRKDAEERLRREIRDQKRGSYDEFRKWVTLTFGFLAFILALVSLLTKTKQPDPCPRNYYRSDAGACVFALTPTEKPPVASREAQVLRLCREWNEKGQCADPTANEWNLSLSDCSKDGCFVYSGDLIVGFISHKQLMNMNEPQYRHQPGFTPVQPSVKR